MLVRKVKPDFVDVVLASDLAQHCEKVTVFKISKSNFAVIVYIESKKYSHDYCVSISFLELRGRLKELKTRMGVKQMFKQGF